MPISQKYQVNQYTIENILNWVKSKEMAIPEIQRPFVWDATKVRNLMDSLYLGYPVGYLIAWQDPTMKLKDGSSSKGKKILIDGQQRVTALTAAILGQHVINKDYEKVKIQIAFQPIEQKFEVLNPAIKKNPSWIPDIAPIVNGEARISQVVREYKRNNPNVNELEIEDSLEELRKISTKSIGFIELVADLDIDTVTEIFVRVNSAGVALSQADFVMSKIAAYEDFGSNLRKCIDYFCHLAISPEFYPQLSETDIDFAKSDYLQKMSWLAKENDDLYDPKYTDLLRVAFTSEFNRGKLGDLVSLLSGRNFETREFEESIRAESFQRLEKSILKFINETNFKRFIMIIKSAGFIDSKFISSQNALDFAYVLYLKLKELEYNSAEIESYVRRWFVMSLLTGRYSTSLESTFDSDIKNITKQDFTSFLKNIEDSDLSDAFWNVTLNLELEKSNMNNPFINTFFAAQVKDNDKGFLSTDITVRDLITDKGDVHHIFPKAYIKTEFNSKHDYNQIANLVYTQQEINIKIGDKSPSKYFAEILKQCEGGELKYGGINNLKLLKDNMRQNCIPESIFTMSINNYFDFLKERRLLMAKKIELYYKSL